MATKHASVVAATTATLIVTAPGHGFITLKNEDAAIKVFIGGATVTNSGATAGLSLAAGATLQVPVVSGEPIFAAAASGTPTVSYIFT